MEDNRDPEEVANPIGYKVSVNVTDAKYTKGTRTNAIAIIL